MNVRGEQPPRVIFLDRVKRRRRQRACGLGAGVVMLAILVVAIATGSFSSSADQLVGAEVGVRLGGAPLQATSGLGSVWVLTCERDCSGRQSAGQIVRVDSQTGKLTQRIDVVDANAFAIGGGGLWITHFYEGTVSRIDLPTGHTTRTVKLALPKPIVPGDHQFVPNSISAGGDSVWVTTARGWVARIDALWPRRNDDPRAVRRDGQRCHRAARDVDSRVGAPGRSRARDQFSAPRPGDPKWARWPIRRRPDSSR